MLPGLLILFALAAPPNSETVVPARSDSHTDALARFGAAVWNLRRDRLLTAARQLEEAAKKDPTTTEPLKELIRVYTLIGREPEAIKIAKKVLLKDPDDFDVAQTLARLLFDAGELKEAIAAAKQAAECPIPIARAEKAVGVYRDLATLCEKANDPATAETALRKAIELVVEKRKQVISSRAMTPLEVDTAAAECLERLGKVLIKRKKYDEAETAFTSAAKLYGDSKKVNDPNAAASLDWNLVKVLQAKGDYQDAHSHLKSVLKHKPISPEPFLRLAQLLRSLDRNDEVVPTLDKLLSSDPENLALQTVLASEMARTGDAAYRRKADSLFAKIQSESNDLKFLEIIFKSHVSTGNARLIVADIDRAFEKLKDNNKEEETNDTAKKNAAKTFAAEKARAIADLLNEDPATTNAVLEAAANDLRAGVTHCHQTYYFLGRLAARHNKWATAESEFKQVLRTAPRGSKEARSEAFVALVAVLHLARKPSELADVCFDGLRHPEVMPQVYCNFYLAEALAQLGKQAEAIDAADKAIQFSGHNDRLMVRLHKVRILGILGKWDAAIALAKHLLDEFPTTADQLQTRYALATSYWGAGKHQESETELRAILDIDPDNAYACNDLGFHLADQGRDLDEAEQLIRNAIVVDKFDRKKTGAVEPESAAFIDSLGWVLFRKGKLQEARSELERALKLHEGVTDPIVWDHMGDVLFRLGEKSKAKEAWEKAAEIYKIDLRVSQQRRDDRFEELKRKMKLIP